MLYTCTCIYVCSLLYYHLPQIQSIFVRQEKFAFLKVAADVSDNPEVVLDWEASCFKGGRCAVTQKTAVAKSIVVLALDLLNTQCPQLTSDDVVVVRRGRNIEVWTMVAFPKNKLILVPFSTEVKDKYWTYGKSASVKSNLLTVKTLALDGRLHHRPPATATPGEDRIFSLFWAIGRTTQKKEANLALEWIDVDVKVSTTLPNKRSYKAEDDKSVVQVPILVNPDKIAAHTLLVAIDDVALHKVMAEQSKTGGGGLKKHKGEGGEGKA